jgi:hypothetical protein
MFVTQGTSAGGMVTVTASANGVMLQSHIQIIPDSPPNFSCLRVQPPVAADPLVISGTVGDFQLPGFIAADGVLIEVHKRSDDSLVTSTTTDKNGNFSLSVPTAGVPFDGYLALSKAGYVSAREYWSRPLTGQTSSVLFLLSTPILNAVYTTIGQVRQPNAGTLALAFTDCGGAPIAVIDADVFVEPSGGWLINSGVYGLPGSTWVFNQAVGVTNISAVSGQTAFGATQFNVVSGQLTFVSVSP